MAKRTVKDIEASIRARLLNLSKKTGENYNAVLLRFFQERFLARLGSSAYRDHFVLKGGLLLLTRHITPFRPTVDIDMLGVAISNNPEHLSTIIKEIAELELDDGVRFNTDAMTVNVIKEDAEYEGLRFTFGAHLGKIKSRMQLDIGFGDMVPMAFIKSVLPTMLTDFSAPELLLYPLESVIAEKFQAIVYLGLATSRMKDFYDILFLAENNAFTLTKLKMAMDATFTRRETDIEGRFFIYEQEYISEKEMVWKPFLKKIGSDESVDFSQVIERIQEFLEPVITAKKCEEDLIWDSKIWRWRTAPD
ncbi:nucleotidyl transferase AbiEii/AbiGii toxin family protein [candidate division KSB1 bacterium]|nr:MAG: nucleotidyl transferase AbiEii/AbiGii toxin family protein [candidate division KSB1 bacterium]